MLCEKKGKIFFQVLYTISGSGVRFNTQCSPVPICNLETQPSNLLAVVDSDVAKPKAVLHTFLFETMNKCSSVGRCHRSLYPFQRCADNGKGKVVMETQRNPTNISIDNSHVFTLPDGDVDTCVVMVVILMK